MAYKALYRTYRPQDFNEVAGQEHITKTFMNALKSGKIAHAYLFSGPRGTGKTSIAKIIAKAVNCEMAPTENPCNVCDTCKGISDNTISDVIEIDAASNNSVDQIREIRDKVKYLPGVTTYKVYIIDEVHMLSTGAFNALLKTLEEPPKHVIFILATTEPHKIPATIHSRCQRFDFRGISVPEMVKRLNLIIEQENIIIDKEAVKVIAESAEGGMRDAISLLDQVVSYTDESISVEDIHAIRGTVSSSMLIEIANHILNNDAVKAINLFEELILKGKEAPRLVENLISFYRDMLMFKNVNTEDYEQLVFKNEAFINLTSKLSNNMLFYYIETLNKAANDMRYTNNAKLYMELSLIKLVDKVEKQEILFEDTINLLKKEIEQLKEMISNKEIVSPRRTVIEDTPITKESIDFEEESPKEIEKEEIKTDIIEEELLVTGLEAVIETKKEIILTEDDANLENEEIDSEDLVSTDKDKLYSSEDIDDSTVEVEIEDKEQEEQNDLFSADLEVEEEISQDDYTTYDIRYVEDVLNNANREVKIDMNKKWFDIERNSDHQDIAYAKMIVEGRLVATDSKFIIIEYENASLCNRLMKPDIKAKIVEILNRFFDKEIDYLALPKDVWAEKSGEFIKKWKNKEVNIKLSPIIHKDLIDIPKIDKDIEDMTPDSVKEAISIFGSDTVRVKRGEKK